MSAVIGGISGGLVSVFSTVILSLRRIPKITSELRNSEEEQTGDTEEQTIRGQKTHS